MEVQTKKDLEYAEKWSYEEFYEYWFKIYEDIGYMAILNELWDNHIYYNYIQFKNLQHSCAMNKNQWLEHMCIGIDNPIKSDSLYGVKRLIKQLYEYTYGERVVMFGKKGHIVYDENYDYHLICEGEE